MLVSTLPKLLRIRAGDFPSTGNFLADLARVIVCILLGYLFDVVQGKGRRRRENEGFIAPLPHMDPHWCWRQKQNKNINKKQSIRIPYADGFQTPASKFMKTFMASIMQQPGRGSNYVMSHKSARQLIPQLCQGRRLQVDNHCGID